MGDRTSVDLTVLCEHADLALELLNKTDGEPDETDFQNDLFWMSFEEVNYGVLDGLRQFIKAGIPYSMEAGPGGSFDRCEEHLRYLEDGSFELKSGEKEWPEITIRKCIDALNMYSRVDPITVLERLLKAACTPSWDNQAVLAKQYLATQLINPQ